MKLLKTVIGLSLMFSVAEAKEDNSAGFQASKMLSHQALGENTEAYPKGKVVKAISVSGYTYFQFQNKDKLSWAAASASDIKEGDKVILMKSFPMHDFKSKTLNKTFSEILFVSQLDVIRPNAN